MSDWSTAWQGLQQGLAHGASLAEQRRARQAQEEFERQRVGFEGERVGIEKTRAQREADIADLNKQLAQERLRRLVNPPSTEGLVPVAGTSGPEGTQVSFGIPPNRISVSEIQGMPFSRAVTAGGQTHIVQANPALQMLAGQVPGQAAAPEIKRPVGLLDVLAPQPETPIPFKPTSPEVRLPRQVEAPEMFPPSGPPVTGIRPAATSAGYELTTRGLSEAEENALRADPSLANRVPSPFREAAQQVVKEHKDNIETFRKAAKDDPNIVYYLGTPDAPGVKSVRDQLNAILSKHRDASGSVDFSKVSPTEAFSQLFALAKVNDPKAVVRQQEIEAISEGAGIRDKFENLYNKVVNGQHLPPRILKGIYDTVQSKANAAERGFFNSLSTLEQNADIAHVPLDRVIQDPVLLNQYQTWKTAPVIDSQERYLQLPSGSLYKDSYGTLSRKP